MPDHPDAGRHSPFARRTMLAGFGGALACRFPCPAHAEKRPLRIGMVTSLTGPFAALGESMWAGMRLLLAEQGEALGGRPVILLVEDDQAKPEEAIRKARKLIGQDGVDLLCGAISSGVALALRDVVTQARIPALILGSADALAREAASPFIVRPTKTNWMLAHTAALWTHAHVAQRRVVTLGSDYAAGREYVGDFAATFRSLGGQLGPQLWAPLGNADFGPMLTTVAAEQPDAVYGFFAGADAVRFLRQWKDYRLAGRIPLVGPGAFFDQEDVLPATGDAALGAIGTLHQSPGAPAAAAFVRAYMAAGRPRPGEFGTTGYVCGQVIQAAVERAGGDLSDWERARQALFAQPVATAFGSISFDSRNGQAVLDIHVNQVVRGPDGRPLDSIVHTYPAVRDPGPAA